MKTQNKIKIRRTMPPPSRIIPDKKKINLSKNVVKKMKYGKPQFKKRLKQFSAGCIYSTDEMVVSTLNGCEDDFHRFGLDKGYLSTKDVGSRIEYYPTQKLLDTILLDLKYTNQLK